MLAVSEQTVANHRVLYQLKITLQDIQPLIWRRIQVWEDITLGTLHTLLQIVMDWEDYHMHDFVNSAGVGSLSPCFLTLAK
jgi:pRiA4b ORF-3-like protein